MGEIRTDEYERGDGSLKKLLAVFVSLTFMFLLAACVQEGTADEAASYSEAGSISEILESSSFSDVAEDINDAELSSSDSIIQDEQNEKGEETYMIKITVGDTELYAEFEDNSTTRALIEQMPMTLSMSDLYGREMCYRYGAYALPMDELVSDGYEVGDIAYWPPGGSLVILYKQNGEQFERQHLGHIDSGVEIFATTGDAEVTFELESE